VDWALFGSTFALIFIAELPDKTALATLMLSARGKPLAVFTGVAAAFLVQTLVAVAFGRVIALLPSHWVHLASGLLFIGFAIWAWRDRNENEDEESISIAKGKSSFLKSAWQAFIVIFIAEWGDLTQLATASLTAKYPQQVLTLFLSALLALWSVTAVTVAIGHKMKALLPIKTLKITSAFLFLGIGLYFVGSTLF
jgi:putative Ca2+/H+ antiporter (TMEM165/GDT1 family)